MIVPAPAVTITGKVSTYDRAADSGATVTRAFCPNCGSAVYSTNAAQPSVIFIRASSLDDPEIFRPQVVVYASRRASWDSIAGDLSTFDRMPTAPG
jgi:hypothetical protein